MNVMSVPCQCDLHLLNLLPLPMLFIKLGFKVTLHYSSIWTFFFIVLFFYTVVVPATVFPLLLSPTLPCIPAHLFPMTLIILAVYKPAHFHPHFVSLSSLYPPFLSSLCFCLCNHTPDTQIDDTLPEPCLDKSAWSDRLPGFNPCPLFDSSKRELLS